MVLCFFLTAQDLYSIKLFFGNDCIVCILDNRPFRRRQKSVRLSRIKLLPAAALNRMTQIYLIFQNIFD